MDESSASSAPEASAVSEPTSAPGVASLPAENVEPDQAGTDVDAKMSSLQPKVESGASAEDGDRPVDASGVSVPSGLGTGAGDAMVEIKGEGDATGEAAQAKANSAITADAEDKALSTSAEPSPQNLPHTAGTVSGDDVSANATVSLPETAAEPQGKMEQGLKEEALGTEVVAARDGSNGHETETGDSKMKSEDDTDDKGSRIIVELPSDGERGKERRPPIPTRVQPAGAASQPEATPAAAAKAKVDPATSKPSAPAGGAAKRVDPETRRANLRARVEREPRDGEAWLALIEDASSRANLEETRQAYEGFLKTFPNSARQWQHYAGMELDLGNFSEVEAIFTRCLRTTPSTDLWRFYLSYSRRVNPMPSGSAASAPSADGAESERDKARKVIEDAYDFALKFIGQSRDSGDVWRDYIALLKEREATSAWQAGQKMDEIRRAYQRAVAIPLNNVEQIWREYDAYENSLNKVTAKKFLAERSPAYMTARTVLREMRALTDALPRPLLPKVPSWTIPPASDLSSPIDPSRERMQAEAWKAYLLWEEGNPLQLEDLSMVYSRVSMVYRKATMHLRFFPEIWYMASRFAQSMQRHEEAESWLRAGMEACPGSFLLHLAFVDQAEARHQTSECAKVFADLIEWTHGQIEQLQKSLDEALAKIDEEGDQAAAESAAAKAEEGAADTVAGEEREEMRKATERREARKEAERTRVQPKIEEMKEAAALAWIKQMHFVRRTEGLRPSRAVFGRARKSAHCTWQVFEANALMEYHCSKDVGVASKVFELALKTFGRDEAFVVRYLDFLISINDDTNARALFERTVTTFAHERARPIWDRWCEYEYSFGDRASIQKLEERLKETYPDEAPIKRFVERSSYSDIDVIGVRDLGFQSAFGGSSAADRAVAAAQEMSNTTTGLPPGVPTGPAASRNGLDGQPSAKRVKRVREDGTTVSPPIAPKGPRAAMQSPPQRRAPLPGGMQAPGGVGPMAQMSGGVANASLGMGTSLPTMPTQVPPKPAYIDVPDGVVFMLSALPSASAFDGPRFQPEDLVDALQRSSIALPPGLMPTMSHGGVGMAARRGKSGFGVPGGRRRF